jgi:hypothetical protein
MATLLFAPTAHAWDPFIAPNAHVEEGNRAMAQQDHQGALGSYDQAARELPSEAGVHLNRGLALLAGEQLDRAREALLLATDASAGTDVRADAYYDLGLSFYREGDVAANETDHESAQQMFREAADAFRRSLRARPRNRDAAWNLELALRRIREQEQAQQEQEERERQEQEEQEQQEGENQDGEGGEPDQQGEEGDDENAPDEQGDQQEQQDQDDSEEGDQSGDDGEGEDGENDQGEEEPAEPEEQGGQDQQPSEPQDEGEGPDQQQPEEGSEAEGQQLPGHVERVLDALQESEENLERYRARARARRERRQPTMDW